MKCSVALAPDMVDKLMTFHTCGMLTQKVENQYSHLAVIVIILIDINQSKLHCIQVCG